MKASSKKQTKQVEFPYSMFPFLLIHSEGKDTKKCYFQCQSHVDKYISRCKFTSKDYNLYVKPGTDTQDQKQTRKRIKK